MPCSFKIAAHAKINLFLNLLSPRIDGFHEVRFVMQTLMLADQLEITVQGGQQAPQLEFRCSDPALSGTDNLVCRAYAAFYERAGVEPVGLSVFLKKNIPIQAGLGGGSADAAAMLMALEHYHPGAVSETQLREIAAQLGSDVPFFLTGGTAEATGRGERITPHPDLPSQAVALIKPRHFGISTPEAYRRIREAQRYVERSWAPWAAFLADPASGSLNPLLHNDFEAVILEAYPDLQEAHVRLGSIGCSALLSGSGPTVFALLADPQRQWPLICEAFSETDWIRLQTRFASRHETR